MTSPRQQNRQSVSAEARSGQSGSCIAGEMSGTVPVELGRAVPSHCFGVCVVRVWANERHQPCWARGVPKVHRVIFNVTQGGQDVIEYSPRTRKYQGNCSRERLNWEVEEATVPSSRRGWKTVPSHT